MSSKTFLKVSGAVASAVETDDTIVLTAPAGYASGTTITGSGAKLWSEGLQYLLTQGADEFTVAYSTDVTITYKGDTPIPAGTKFDFYIPQIGAFDALTDSTGGTASNTLAAITAGSSYAQADMTACKNGLASLAAKIALIQTALVNQNVNNA
jgi:hypothetical protein